MSDAKITLTEPELRELTISRIRGVNSLIGEYDAHDLADVFLEALDRECSGLVDAIAALRLARDEQEDA